MTEAGAQPKLLRALERNEKLENLCRELQKQREALIEDSKRALEAEAQKRIELSDKFQQMLGDIQVKMEASEEHQKQQRQLLDTNETLRAQLLAAAERDEKLAAHHAAELKAKELEAQLAEARLRQCEELLGAEKQRSALIEESALKTERELRAELQSYSTKYASFNESLHKSTEALQKMRADMLKSSKRIKKLEAENSDLRGRVSRADAQKLRLEQLCRSLQEERRRERISSDRAQADVGNVAADDLATAPAADDVDTAAAGSPTAADECDTVAVPSGTLDVSASPSPGGEAAGAARVGVTCGDGIRSTGTADAAQKAEA